jgi:trk system potassium uptake protein TrkH
MKAIMFEAISAFGTVGLSLGITFDLSVAGKLLITVLMFVGRVGPLALVFSMVSSKDPAVSFPEEKVMVG